MTPAETVTHAECPDDVETDAATEARAKAAAAGVRLAYAWGAWWQAVKELGEATRPTTPGGDA